jgi:hypothetical protein
MFLENLEIILYMFPAFHQLHRRRRSPRHRLHRHQQLEEHQHNQKHLHKNFREK